ncbi:MAG TPA: hypothetical protein VJQ57_09380 [Acidimicrobiia bacterium]|nr:hypothetical protein [Acidimicrobiia bacterium]
MLLGIGHVARTGKSVSAEALARALGFRIASFAQPLKDLALHADPLIQPMQATNVGIGHGRLKWIVQGTGWEEAKDRHKEVRLFLQNLGLGARKVFGENFWVEQAMARYEVLTDKIVFADVRFINEAEAIQAAGGKLIKIDRPGHKAMGHISETELIDFDKWDAVIDNNGSVMDLEEKVIETVRAWLPKEVKK